MDTIRLRTMATILKFVQKGGSVFAHPMFPKYAAEGHPEDHRIVAMVEQIRSAGGLGGSSHDAPPLGYLIKSRVPPQCELAPSSQAILSTRIMRPDGAAFFLVNTSGKSYAGKCTFASKGKPVILDPATGDERAVEWGKTGDSKTWVTLKLQSFESLFVQFA